MTYEQYLDAVRGVGFTLGTIVAVLTLYTFWKAWRNKWFTPLRTMAETANQFAAELFPDILEKMEDDKVIPKGILRRWLSIMSRRVYATQSPRTLTDYGLKMLVDSGIKEIIETHYDDFAQYMEEKKITTAIGVEEASFYTLNSHAKEDSEMMRDVMNWLFKNSNIDFKTVIFVGSFHLRDKYLDDHKEILEQNNS